MVEKAQAGILWRTVMRIVMKFGGTSLADISRIDNAARLIATRYRAGDQVVVVVSAQGDCTDELIEKGRGVSEKPAAREMDVLLSAGEQISMALMTMRLMELGCPAVSLLGWQAGICTDGRHGSARITGVDCRRIMRELEKENVVVVAGFQGVDSEGDVTTIGRGGSDTTAVSLAAALAADVCQIYTDVSGVFSADPRVVGEAVQHDEISYDEMMEMATLGAKVLHNRSVILAKNCGVDLEVRSSFAPERGTRVGGEQGMGAVSGVTCDSEVAMMTITGVDDGEATCRVFSVLAKSGVAIDVIIRSPGTAERRGVVSFSLAENCVLRARAALEETRASIGYNCLIIEPEMAKVSAIGAGMQGDCGVAARMLEALRCGGVEPKYITTGEIRISVIIPRAKAEEAVRRVHREVFGK